MIKTALVFLAMSIVFLAAGCDKNPDLSLCTDYVDDISGNRFRGVIELTENNFTFHTSVTVDIVLSENEIELSINEGSQNLHSALHRYNCIEIENGTLPFIEILDRDDNVIGCITGSPLSVLNYDLEVVPNATNTVASFAF